MSISSIGGYASSVSSLYRPAAPAAATDSASTQATQTAPQQPATLDRDGDGDVDTGSVDNDRGKLLNIKA
ncbi:hypothetical protein UCD39_10535 [Nitrospirillum sp. BR 11752]|uniref:hypothetical protein n=1 Tax=Nitrospirillum sp. BR 11752 TaxID=3104293 RepID=UPI002E9E63A9|nr:hypothetical protein [Nitrospirillum sp. BR 11752]